MFAVSAQQFAEREANKLHNY